MKKVLGTFTMITLPLILPKPPEDISQIIIVSCYTGHKIIGILLKRWLSGVSHSHAGSYSACYYRFVVFASSSCFSLGEFLSKMQSSGFPYSLSSLISSSFLSEVYLFTFFLLWRWEGWLPSSYILELKPEVLYLTFSTLTHWFEF